MKMMNMRAGDSTQHLDRVSSASSSETTSEASATSGGGSTSSGRGSGGTHGEDTRRIIRGGARTGGGGGGGGHGTREKKNKSTSVSSKRTIEKSTGLRAQQKPPPPPPQPQAAAAASQAMRIVASQNASHKSPGEPEPGKSKTLKSANCSSTRHLLILILFIIGLTACVISILCLLLLPSFVSQQIAKKLVLKNNSMLLERWSRPNVPMYFKVWLYDIKNAQEIIDKRDTKPRVEEIGPFVFNLRRQKDVISFAGDNLYYTERKVYHFNRELSCCAINTTVTIPNIPLVAVVDRALGYNLPLVGRFIPRLINRAIQSLREQLFVRKQVGEILFDGYDVELLRMVSRVGSLVGLPQQSQRFALLKGRNDTWRPEQDGVWAINTGQRDRRQFGRVSSWNSYKRLPFWPEPACNVINGSDGTLFPPPIRRTEPLYIFNQELCRTVNLVFERPSDVRSIKSLRFVLNPLNFAHTMTPASATSSGAQQSTGSNARGVHQPLLLANQTAAAVGRTRINPIFQNRDRLAPAAVGTQPAGEPVDPISILGIAAPPPPPTFLLPATPPRPQMGVATNSNQPQPRTSTARGGGGGGGRRVVGGQNNALRPSASEAIRPIRVRDATAAANLLNDQDTRPKAQDTSGATAVAKLAAEEKIRREQEKLIGVAQEAQLANERKSRVNPQTCFCDRKQTNLNGVNVCEFDGLIDLSKCSKQAQVIFGSMPHFYNSDPRLLRQVSGLAPNASKHTTYLDIEPNTGLVLGGKRRVQLNVIIKHNNEIDGFENINDMLVPIVWFEESAMIPEETAQKFRSMYVDRIKLVNYILFSLLIGSIALLALDARLLLSTPGSWRQFKWHLGSGAGKQVVALGSAPLGGNPRKLSPMDDNFLDEETSADRAVVAIKGRSFTHLSSPLPLHAAANQLNGSSGSVESPLLQHSRSSFSSSTPNSSPPETPAGSPELRKWSLAAIAVPSGRQISVSERASTTRVHLNGSSSNGGGNAQQVTTSSGGVW